jgi:hypothetical protein
MNVIGEVRIAETCRGSTRICVPNLGFSEVDQFCEREGVAMSSRAARRRREFVIGEVRIAQVS